MMCRGDGMISVSQGGRAIGTVLRLSHRGENLCQGNEVSISQGVERATFHNQPVRYTSSQEYP
jgi:hypothetical protein